VCSREVAANALADALAVAEAVDCERLVCPTVVLCAVVAWGNVLSPVVVVVVPVCAPVVPVVIVVVPRVGFVVLVFVPVVPVVVSVVVPVVGFATCSWRFATVGPTSPLIPRWIVAFEEGLSIPSASTMAHSFSANTLTTARPRPSVSPPPDTSSCPPPR
jgi:hypothetical protein